MHRVQFYLFFLHLKVKRCHSYLQLLLTCVDFCLFFSKKVQCLVMEAWLIQGVVGPMLFLKARVNPFTVVPFCTDDT